MPGRLILASASPRRRELLALLGLPFDVVPSQAQENDTAALTPVPLVRTLAAAKASDVLERIRDEEALILGADTIVVTEVFGAPAVLNKPVDAEDARRMLSLLSGTTHTVYTGLCLCRRRAGSGAPGDFHTDTLKEVVATEVRFRALTPALIDAYIATGGPFDKAGAYGIQGYAAAFVEAVYGDYFNVVGLPLECTRNLLLPFFPEVREAPLPPTDLPFPIYPKPVKIP
jgi:septum formation protein